MNELVVAFTPEPSDGTWTLHVTASAGMVRLPALDSRGGKVTGLARPALEDLNSRMLEAHTGFIVRVEPGGSIVVSATGRSAVVVHEWLVGLLASAG